MRDVAGREAKNGPARRFPDRLLARVLADIEVERASVDLDDQPFSGPAEVCFDTGSTCVEARQWSAGVAQDEHRLDLRTASRPLERQPGVAGEHLRDSPNAATAAGAAHRVADRRQRRQLESDRLAHGAGQGGTAHRMSDVDEGALDGGYRDAAQHGALALQRVAAKREHAAEAT